MCRFLGSNKCRCFYNKRISDRYSGTVPVSPARSGMHCYGSQAAWPCDSSSSRIALVASRWEDPVQAVLAGSQVVSGTHTRIYLRPSDIGANIPGRSTLRVATSVCCGHVDELVTEPVLLLHREHGTGYRWSLNCCDRWTCFIVIWKHFCFILSMGTRIRTDSVMRPQSSRRGCNTSASVTEQWIKHSLKLSRYLLYRVKNTSWTGALIITFSRPSLKRYVISFQFYNITIEEFHARSR